jgi:hypothetical protein
LVFLFIKTFFILTWWMRVEVNLNYNVNPVFLTRGIPMRFIYFLSTTIILSLLFSQAQAQDRSFLFTFTSPELSEQSTSVNYSSAYGQKTFEPFGGDGIEQNLRLKANVWKSLSFIGHLGLANDKNSTVSSQQGELIANLMRADDHIVDFSAGVGLRHEYSGDDVLLGRFVVGRQFISWQSYGNFILEKPMSNDRDELDLITTFGFSYTLPHSVRLGIEAVGQDLEGFWDKNEAEGGATLFVGPTVGFVIPGMPCNFTFGGGIIFHATTSTRNNQVDRDLPIRHGNGFVIQNMIIFGL